MSFDSIIEELFLSTELDDCIEKMVREDLRDDFKQELFVILLNQDKKKIEEIYGRNELKYFVVRIIVNLASQTRNVFHKKYLNKSVVSVGEFYEEADTICPEDETKMKNEIIFEKISEMDNHLGTFYYRALTELVKRHGSMNKAAKETGIPLTTISNGFKKIREHLKKVVDV